MAHNNWWDIVSKNPASSLAYGEKFVPAQNWIDAAEKNLSLIEKHCQRKELAYSSAALFLIRALISAPTIEQCADIHILLKNNDHLLRQFHIQLSKESQFVTASSPPLNSEIVDEKDFSQVREIAQKIKLDGFAVWPKMFVDDRSFHSTKQFGLDLHQEFLASIPTSTGEYDNDTDTPGRINSRNGGYFFMGAGLNDQGRYRTHFPGNIFPTGIPQVDLFHNHPKVKAVIDHYFEAPSKEVYMLYEHLKPAMEEQIWHRDGLTDQLKVMVLLDDVTDTDGPLHVLRGSHKAHDFLFPHVKSWLHRTKNHADTPEEQIVLAGLEEWVGYGKKGDAIFFDTGILHHGTPCTNGTRHNVILTYVAPTLRTHVMQQIVEHNIPKEWLEIAHKKYPKAS